MNNQQKRTTFAQSLVQVRGGNLQRVWNKALCASQLRHLAYNQKQYHASKILAGVKLTALRQVVHIGNRDVRVTMDDHYQVGLLSVHWYGHGRLHLPLVAAVA